MLGVEHVSYVFNYTLSRDRSHVYIFSPQVYVAALHSEVRRVLSGGKPALDDIDDLFDEKSPFVNPFSKVETPHQQLSFYRKHLNFVVSIIVQGVCYAGYIVIVVGP